MEDCPNPPENYPYWDSNYDGVLDNLNDYQNNGSITSAVFVSDENVGTPGDMLAAFVADSLGNSELRGVAIATEVPFGPYEGSYQFLMLIYSNEASGEMLDLQFYDYETDIVYNVSESFEFVADMTLGNVVSPEILNASVAIDIDVPLASGWNWMSLNVYTDDMSLNNMLSSLDDSAEYIKSQSGYADYYADFGWFGTLEYMDNLSMFKLRMGLEDNITLAGIPADVATSVFDLPAGWNWIGYTPQISIDPNTALSNIPSGNAEYLKSQAGYADFYVDFGWFGTLEIMDPFLGYQLRLAEATSFVYNDNDLLLASAIPNHNDYSSLYKGRSNVCDDLNIHDYEFNGTITAALYLDGERIESDDFVLSAFNGEQCVGTANELYFPLVNKNIYPLMVYSNEVNNSLTYEVYQKSTDTYFNVMQTIPFQQDMTHGNGVDPVVMELARQADMKYDLSMPYPNPFNPVVNIDLTVEGNNYVDARIYDIQGREVAVLHNGMMDYSFKTLTWIAQDNASGIYFIKVVIDGQQAYHKKIVLLK